MLEWFKNQQQEIMSLSNNNKVRLAKFQELYLPWLTAAMAALSSNWAADAIPATLQVWMSLSCGEFSLSRALSIFLFTLSVFLLFKQRNSFFKPRTRLLCNEEPEKRKHLVIFLSDLRKGVQYDNGIPEGLHLTFNLVEDLSIIEKHKEITKQYWPWEMCLRGMRPHFGKLETVTIACSTKSIFDVDLFLKILRGYQEFENISFNILCKGGSKPVPKNVAFSGKNCSGLDFESFDELSDTLWSFLKKNQFPENEVMIDFTGGQKVTSVVAAALTFNRKIKAQYVQTSYPWDVVSYDVIHAFYDTGNLG